MLAITVKSSAKFPGREGAIHGRIAQIGLVAIFERLNGEPVLVYLQSGAQCNVSAPRLDYMTTVINKHVKDRLVHTARGIIIPDEKEMFEERISTITRFLRFEVAKTQRTKWLVEFRYSIDSQKRPMVQLSDLVIYCAKKFLELD